MNAAVGLPRRRVERCPRDEQAPQNAILCGLAGSGVEDDPAPSSGTAAHWPGGSGPAPSESMTRARAAGVAPSPR
ncbi:hypothetical protein ACE1OC_37620 [Streptomyces sp. DSM 116496]|uniref:hypothetical protein n=1 Tax=Streptomyces stoeckheimensis TaxID=3344656 RepID=UPI0038B2E591